ncbi:MAG: ABC transporter ATP-binding protein [Chloroflexi bacterium]|nr:MAG: ABC transporter ATP-binding protein [Chloroflexota bacterium]
MRYGAWRAGATMARFRLRRYLIGGSFWALNHCLPLVTGLLLKAVFDRVSGVRPAYATGLALLAALVAAEVGRGAVLWSALAYWPGWLQPLAARIRANLLEAVLRAPGPLAGRLPASAGDAVARFRDDVEDLLWFVDGWVDVAGAVVLTAVALAVMLSISPPVTVAAVVPLVGVLAGTRALGRLVRRAHGRMREQGSSVTDLIADLFAGVLTLKTAGAEERAVERFRARNATRRQAAVRAQLVRNLMSSLSGGAAQVTTGLVLLLAAAAMRDGRFTVGDLALFSAYAASLTNLPRWLGSTLVRQREAGVALGRLARLHPEGRLERVLSPGPFADQPPAGRLRALEVRGLTARHGGSDAGIVDVDLTVPAGALTVVTGPVGSGKSTLVRAVLGLIPVEAGGVWWNGAPVPDPGSFLVPPRVAYAGQVARLFSATVEENLRLGWPAGEEELWAALRLAQLDEDVAAMPLGLATVVGPRGSRLSGGQLQRAAVARALVRAPELLVLDDVSSALDQRTEERLWRALADAGITCLAASHRPAALDHADHVVVLDGGRVVRDRVAG